MEGNVSRKRWRRRFSVDWPYLVYALAAALGLYGVAGGDTVLLTFAGELLVVPQLVQVQQRRNHRRRREDKSRADDEDDEDA
jgi:hypothetical protein